MSEVADISNHGSAMSISQLSRAFGSARETVAKRLATAAVEPCGQRNGYAVYLIKEAAAAILAGQSPASTTDPALMTPTDKRAHWQAENERLKFQETSGQLVPSEQVRVEMAFIANTVSRCMLTLPDSVARDFRIDPEVIAHIEKKTRAVLQQIADRLASEDDDCATGAEE